MLAALLTRLVRAIRSGQAQHTHGLGSATAFDVSSEEGPNIEPRPMPVAGTIRSRQVSSSMVYGRIEHPVVAVVPPVVSVKPKTRTFYRQPVITVIEAPVPIRGVAYSAQAKQQTRALGHRNAVTNNQRAQILALLLKAA